MTSQQLTDTLTLREALRGEASRARSPDEQVEYLTRLRQLDDAILRLRQKIDTDLAALLGDLDRDLGKMAREDLPIFAFGGARRRDAPDHLLLSQIETARPLASEVFAAEQELLKLITIRHIQEEMDSMTYLHRVENGFARLAASSEQEAGRIGSLSEADIRATGFLKEVAKMQGILQDNIDPDWLPDRPNSRRSFDAMKDRLTAMRNLLLSCQRLMAKDVPGFCDQTNRRYVRDVTSEAASKAEKIGWASLMVMGAAGTTTLASNWAISESGNFPQMEHRGQILIVIFIAMLGISSYAGSRFRTGRIARLNRQMRTAFTSMLTLGVTPAGPARGAGWMRAMWPRLLGRLSPRRAARQLHGDDDSRFPEFHLDWFGKGPTRNADRVRVGRFALDRRTDNAQTLIRRAAVFGFNGAFILGIPLFLAGYPTTFATSWNENPQHFLIGRAADGHACLLAKGDVIRVTDRDLTLRNWSPDKDAEPPVRAIIDRSLVQRIDRIAPSGARNCDSAGPIVVEHRGLAAGWAGTAEATDVSAIVTSLESGFRMMTAGLVQRDAPPAVTVAPVTLMPAAAPLTGLPLVNIFVDGTQLTLSGERNAMLLPLFRTPVLGLEQGGPVAAYAYGRSSLATGAEDGERVSAFLTALFQPLYHCAVAGATLDLDVVGFASTSWQIPGQHEVAGLNVELAEGRRAALIERLWSGMPDQTMAHRIRIMDAAGAFVPLDQLMGVDLALQRRFVGDAQSTAAAKMAEHLVKFVADTPRGQLADSLRELLSRSAVIQIIGASDRDCLGQPIVQAEAHQIPADGANAVAEVSGE